MRFKEAFSLYKRKLVSGRIVFYYQVYDGQGRRICGQSTGKTNKTAAREYCNELLRIGKLVPESKNGVVAVPSVMNVPAANVSGVYAPVPPTSATLIPATLTEAQSAALAKWGGRMPTFEEYSQGWWNFETCAYLKKRKGRRAISKGYAVQGKNALRNHLVPTFGSKRIDTLTTFEIDAWLSSSADRGYSNNTGNLAFKILRIMLGEASLAGIIPTNPCAPIQLLKDNSKKIEILSVAEVKKIFPANWKTIWDDEMFYIINKLAACTGMRFGELMGLRGEYLFSGYINVCGQVTPEHGYGDTKSHKAREIPIAKEIENDLLRLKKQNGDGYLFSFDVGVTPVKRPRVYAAFFRALERIGIDDKERRRRNISMHSWRHFLNTELLANNVTKTKVRSITGHSSDNMTEHYTHLNTSQFSEVLAVQENLLHTDTVKKTDKPKIKTKASTNTKCCALPRTQNKKQQKKSKAV